MAKKYGIVIDTQRCIGCFSCSVSCKAHNNIPNDVWWHRVITVGGEDNDTPAGKYPDLSMYYTPFRCMHCEKPACVEVCPTGSTWKDEETGIVMQNSETCIGCQSCITACPYEGARTYLEKEPEFLVDFPVGDIGAPVHLVNTVGKCTMCYNRLERDREPGCVEGCTASACFFGDLNDPQSEVSKKIASREWFQLQPEAGTVPQVYYLK